MSDVANKFERVCDQNAKHVIETKNAFADGWVQRFDKEHGQILWVCPECVEKETDGRY